MKFKTWREAEKRATELKPQLDELNGSIEKLGVEARGEDLSIETRDEKIKKIEADVVKRDALQTEYDEAVKAMDDLKAAEERQFGFLANITTPKVSERQKRTEDGDNVIATRAYELAWAVYIRSGNETAVRALMDTQGSGKILTPHTLVNKIEDTLKKGGKIINLCDTVSIKGIVEYPIALNYTDPELHDETGDTGKKEKEITLSSVSMEPQFIAEILKTTRKFENDSVSAFWDWLMAELPDALRRIIDRKILSGGQGAKDGIHGILTNADTNFVATKAIPTLGFNIANEAVAMLDDGVEDNITILMNRKTFFNTIMGMAGADSHPIWKQVTTMSERPSFVLGGYPVEFTKELPEYNVATEGEAYMVVGDFKAMKLNFPDGMQTNLVRDPITEMHNNVVRYLSEIYVAGNITRIGHFVKVTK